MSWLKKILPERIRTDPEKAIKKEIPEGVWEQCPECEAMLYRPELARNLHVCPACSHHLQIRARERLKSFFDLHDFEEIGQEISPVDALGFKDVKPYKERIVAAQRKTGEKDALIVGKGTLHGIPIVACAFDFAFIGGSM